MKTDRVLGCLELVFAIAAVACGAKASSADDGCAWKGEAVPAGVNDAGLPGVILVSPTCPPSMPFDFVCGGQSVCAPCYASADVACGEGTGWRCAPAAATPDGCTRVGEMGGTFAVCCQETP